jgi:hypothetical protein
MKGKSSAAALGLIGGLALGVWIGAEVIDDRDRDTTPAAVATVAEEPAPAPEPIKPKRVKRAVRAASSAPAAMDSPAAESADAPKLVMTVPVSSPEFQASMKPVLARGTKVPVAVEGFSDAEQFATLARASRNTQVPFILLKHRVLTEGMSLEEAIRASKPDLDARVEALRAKGEARGDILRLQMNSASN